MSSVFSKLRQDVTTLEVCNRELREQVRSEKRRACELEQTKDDEVKLAEERVGSSLSNLSKEVARLELCNQELREQARAEMRRACEVEHAATKQKQVFEENLEQSLSKLRRDVTTLESSNQKLREEIRAESLRACELEQTIKDKDSAIEKQLASSLSKLHSDLASMGNCNQKLRDDIQAERRRACELEQDAKKSRDMAEQELQLIVVANQGLRDELRIEKQRVCDLEQFVGKSKAAADEESASTLSKLRKNVKFLETCNQDLREDLRIERQRASDLEKLVRTTKVSADEAQSTLSKLRGDMAILESDNQELRKEVRTETERTGELEKSLERVNTVVNEDLHSVVAHLRAQVVRLEECNKELRDEVAIERRRAFELEQCARNSTKDGGGAVLNLALSQLRADLTRLEAANCELREEVHVERQRAQELGQAAKKANKGQRDRSDPARFELCSEVARLEACNRKLQDEIRHEKHRGSEQEPSPKHAAEEAVVLRREVERLHAENARLRNDLALAFEPELRLQRGSVCTEDSLASTCLTARDEEMMAQHPWKKGLRPQLQQLRELTDLLHGFLENAREPLAAVRGACIQLSTASGRSQQETAPPPFEPGQRDGDQVGGVAAVLDLLRFFERALTEPAAVAFPPPMLLGSRKPSTPLRSMPLHMARQDTCPKLGLSCKEGPLDRARQERSKASMEDISVPRPRLSTSSHEQTAFGDTDEVSRITLGQWPRIPG